MSDPIRLDKFKKKRRQTTAKGKTLCKRGFHDWEFDAGKQFDVKHGKLVSIKRCKRCNVTKTVVA